MRNENHRNNVNMTSPNDAPTQIIDESEKLITSSDIEAVMISEDPVVTRLESLLAMRKELVHLDAHSKMHDLEPLIREVEAAIANLRQSLLKYSGRSLNKKL